MNKISSFIAACIFVFGLTSCSGSIPNNVGTLPRLNDLKVRSLGDTYARDKGYDLSEYQAPSIKFDQKEQQWRLFYDQKYQYDPVKNQYYGEAGKHFGIYIDDKTGNMVWLSQGM